MLVILLVVALSTAQYTLHLVPHSHTDAGWIETIDTYYSTKVESIFRTMVDALESNPNRTFTWADTNYLAQWYDGQDKTMKSRFKALVDNGQIEFVGGGWVQNDESLSDVKSIINQMTTGLRYLEEEFGQLPKVGWQIDPFGYNHFMPSLFSQFGYDYLVLNRVGDSRKDSLKTRKDMLFQLQADSTQSGSDTILTHVLPIHYEPKDYNSMIGGVPGTDASLEEKVKYAKWFIEEYVDPRIRYTPQTKQLMILMGKDFGYDDAKTTFSKIDKIISILTNSTIMSQVIDYPLDVKYSHATTYFKAVEEERPRFNTYDIDFIIYDETLKYLHPNADPSRVDYWVGYYSTNPKLKSEIRRVFNLFRAFETLKTYNEINGHHSTKVEDMFLDVQRQVSYMLHHDAITGTSRDHTIDDYFFRINEAERVIL